MTQATLTFNLENPDDERDFEALSQAKKVLFFLGDIREMMRTMIKYDTLPRNLDHSHFQLYSDEYPDLNLQTPVSSLSGDVAVDLFRDAFFELAKEENINLELYI